MKKRNILLLISLLLLTGCTKKLNCTKVEKESMLTTKETFLIAYKNKKVKNIQIDLKSTLKKKQEDYAEVVEKNLKEQFAKYENKKGISLTSSTNDNIVNIHLFIDLDKMDKQDKKKLNFTNLEKDYATLKKELEEKKYQCK